MWLDFQSLCWYLPTAFSLASFQHNVSYLDTQALYHLMSCRSFLTYSTSCSNHKALCAILEYIMMVHISHILFGDSSLPASCLSLRIGLKYHHSGIPFLTSSPFSNWFSVLLPLYFQYTLCLFLSQLAFITSFCNYWFFFLYPQWSWF